MFRFVASLCRNIVVSTTVVSLTILLVFLFGGFIIPKCKISIVSFELTYASLQTKLNSAASMPVWLKWAFWFSPLAYGEIGLAVNEFLAPRWQKVRVVDGSAHVFHHVIKGLRTCYVSERTYPNPHPFLFFLSVTSRNVMNVGAFFGFTLLFNIGFVLALSFLKPPGSRAIFSSLSPVQRNEEFTDNHAEEKSSKRG
ncbi:hypothetical protein POM88_052537 [Heracleum sosnowskyi]|uniref:Plant PDR ABC transporter associated domain-containing protein n=1 Tax=Heracleum sosnowskyi TaxID=360622 RepID=A0AAD8LYU2_9APIA|nr:hypothetical protein POM88_052537 [Heracleum sosnowskyi]